MASDKEKRFRVHVVKELYETERDYTQQLEFTVMHILAKAREKGQHDNSFTAEIIDTLFCNIEAILEFHRQLVAELEACIGKGPAYETQIAGCYLQQKEQFHLYQRYGESNEQAQKLLYELYDKEQFKAFFVACMLLGGRSDEDISGLVFKPIQRVCKYPLLFRELSKYTPEGHSDYAATQGCLAMMRDICSVINEAKRRVEKLEWIADWQSTVEGWEGTNVVDTCNELIKEGPLIKISAGNTQERQFYLFDNLLVYCKKNSLLSKGKGVLFRGRVPVANLDIEDIVDGTSDYHTHGIAVSNSWKVHNVAKNKWFVLVAKSSEEKASWIEAIRREKEKRKRAAAALAQDNRALALDKGEKLYFIMRRDKFMRDHKSRFRTYPNSFTGAELVGWLVEKEEVADNDQAVLLGQALLENGVIHHVADRHQFKNDRDLLYRYRYDDGTFRSKIHCSDVTARGVRAYTTLHALFDPLIKEQKVGLRAMKGVVNSSKLIDWWLADKDIHSRQAGVELGQELFATGFLRHATDEHNFKDGTFLYGFPADDGHDGGRDRKLTSVLSKPDFRLCSVTACRTVTLVSSEDSFSLSSTAPLTVTSVSAQAQLAGLCEGHTVLAVNGLYSVSTPTIDKDTPTSLLIARPTTSETAELAQTSSGLGFHIKGNSPVVIHDVDKGSSAAGVGIVPGTCILKVGSSDVVRSSHEAVVSAVRAALSQSKAESGEARVSLKLSFPLLEQLAVYQYESTDGALIGVHERTTESPYTFSLPSQVLRSRAARMRGLVEAVAACQVTEERVAEYLDSLSRLAVAYERVGSVLAQPRWPSYKLHAPVHLAMLEFCPTNLHTTLLDVVVPGDSPSSPGISPSDVGTSPSDEALVTCYPSTTMAAPVMKGSLVDTKVKADTLDHVLSREELTQTLEKFLADMKGDSEAIARMLEDDSLPSPSLLTPPGLLEDDLTPSNSPLLPRKQRAVSMSNPAPLIALVAESLVNKAHSLEDWLGDKLLTSVLCETDPLLSPTASQLISQFRAGLPALCQRITDSTPGEPLLKSATALLDSTTQLVSALKLRLAISLALVDDVGLREGCDKLLCQVLSGIASGVAHSLLAAVRARLNPGAEYSSDNQLASTQWLQLAARKGILIHLQATMATGQGNELATLRDLNYVLSQLSHVTVHVEESEAHLLSTEVPRVSVAGVGPELHYHLPPRSCQALPQEFFSQAGVKIVPLLFNQALEDGPEHGMMSSLERQINAASFKSLKDYYQGLRGLRLDKSNLPEESQAKLLAIHNISQPLNAMDILVRQMEVAVRDPSRPGAGLLSLTAELAQRMGAVRVNMCDSGVFRSCLASSLETVSMLTRCHGLPFKSFRTALNKMRRKGSLHYIARKNNAEVSKSLPRQPPKLYQLPPEDTET